MSLPTTTTAPATDDWGLPVTTNGETAAAAAAEGEKNEGRRARDKEQEEEDNTLTLDQYLAQKAEKEASLLPKLETRKANEGADDTLWKDAIPVQKDEGAAYFAAKVHPKLHFLCPLVLTFVFPQPKSAPKARTEKKEKVFIEIDARFDRPDRGGRGGGRGRGSDRGDRGARPPRGRGGGRGGRPNGSIPIVNVDDEKAFPSLS